MTHRPWPRVSLFLLLLLFCCSNQGFAQTSDFNRDDFAAPPGTRGIVAADLNDDGWTDLALANAQPGTVTVFVNRGAAGGFMLARTLPLGGGPFDITAGDFDMDGFVDLAVANADGNTIDVIMSASTTGGSWSFKWRRPEPAIGNPRGVTAADINGDGALDLVYTAFYQNAVVVLYGDNRGSFSTAGLPPIAVGLRPQGVAAADLNNDRRMDLVVANTGASLLTALYGNGAGGFTRRDVPGPQQLNVVAVSDVNDDGWIDIAAVSTARGMLAYWRGAAPEPVYSGSIGTGSSPRGLAIADVNGDERPDVIVANRGDSTAAIVLQRPGGVFALSEALPAGWGARAVAAEDFNQDGRLDFATGNEFAGAVSVFRNAPGLPRAAFGFSRQRFLVQPYANGVSVGDLNHNGIPDFVAGNTVILDGDGGTLTALPLPSGSQIRDVAMLDFNRDGHTDVAILFRHYDWTWNSLMDGFYIYSGDGTGALRWEYGQGGFADSLRFAVGDLNRDGWDDLVVASTSPTNRYQSVLYVALNNRHGSFNVRQTLLTGTVYALALGDVTADGKLDVVVSTDLEKSITVEIGDGAGGFSTEADTSIETVPYNIALTDFNRDGFLDFIAVDGENVFALTGNGQGHYTAVQKYQQSYLSGRYAPPYSVLAVDLTDDGLPDIVTGAGLLLPGTANGTFGPAEEFEWWWWRAAAVDFDADGDLDLVASDGYSEISVLFNQRTMVNHAPVATAGRDRTFPYRMQFDDEGLTLTGYGSEDPDLHALTYEWREDGKVIAYGIEVYPPRWLTPGAHTFELIIRDGRGGESRDTVTWTVTNFPEVVMYMDYSDVHGNWQIVQDPTAAGGYRTWNPNRSASKVASPLANPPDYVEVRFTPDPTLEYKLWIRGKAENNYWGNDSVWVQFSDAADAAGNPLYRIGTTSALAVNLEECSGCGLSGWGWEDDGWGAVDKPGVTLRFPKADWQTIRIQTREDGISIDQIVLSAQKYMTARPGTAKNDTTILERTQY